MKSSPFKNWRTDEKTKFRSAKIEPHIEAISAEYKDAVQAQCIQQYQKAMQLMEHSVAEVSLQYVTRNPDTNTPPFKDKFRQDDPQQKSEELQSQNQTGVLLNFANVYAQRYLDLFEAYIAWEIDKEIPMLPVSAGQMKLDGFTSEDIIIMKADCIKYSEISDAIKQILNGNTIVYEKIIHVMAGLSKDISLQEFINEPIKRDTFLSSLGLNQTQGDRLKDEFSKYSSLPQKDLLDKAHLLMHDFRHLEHTDIAVQLYYVSLMKPFKAEKDERLLMEIRHRIGGDNSIHQNSPGTLGGNPLAYLNMLKEGEPENPAAEFREKMYFVYMCNHFANAVIRDQERIDFINRWLNANGKGWQLDQAFIDEMKNRGTKKYIPPIFRYGANAALNTQLRELHSHEEVAKFYEINPNITVKEVMEGLASINDYYRLKLSDRELLNQIGELYWDDKSVNQTMQQLNFGTGAAVFKLHEHVTSEMNESARKYLNVVNTLHIPVFAGISGTLDQSTTMAGLVGLGVDMNLDRRKLELETIKLAYLAFMLPGRDHSVHEIMQSSTTFGLDYIAGPGYQQYLYPPDSAYMLQQINAQQMLRGSNFPDYYLSAEYADIALREIISKTIAPEIADTIVAASQESKKYYIGIPLAGTSMTEVFQNLKNPDITRVNTNNSHITIGWSDSEISPTQLKLINEKLSPILSNYENLTFKIDKIELWNNGKDVIAILKEYNQVLENMRKKIQTELNEMHLSFEYEAVPHVKIGYLQIPKSDNEIKQTIPIPAQLFVFDRCAIMHFDFNRERINTDFEIGFKHCATKIVETKLRLELEQQEAKIRHQAVLQAYHSEQKKVQAPNKRSGKKLIPRKFTPGKT